MAPDEGDSGDGKVLSPNELDLTDKDGVEEIEEGRFVVSPDGSQPDVPGGEPTEVAQASEADATTDDADPAPQEPSAPAPTPSVPDSEALAEERTERSPEITRSDVRDWTESQLQNTACEYGYHLSLKAGDEVRHHTLHSDDVAMVFNNLLLWYAQTVDSEMPPGAVLGILLMEANSQIRYPVSSIEQLLISHGLSPDDSIGTLLKSVREDEEVVFPPRNATR